MSDAKVEPASIPANASRGKEAKALDEEDGNRDVKLVSKDKKTFTLSRKLAYISTLVKTSLENDKAAESVDINLTGVELQCIVEYMRHHNGVEPPIVEKPLRSKLMKDVCVDKWDADFADNLGKTQRVLYDVLLAANYMDIKSLLYLLCAKVASKIKGQPLEKIPEILRPDNVDEKKEEKKA